MAVRDILNVKDKSDILHTPSDPVDPAEILQSDTQKLIDDMIETKAAAEGIGIAAVQIGVLKRIIIVEMPKDGPTAFINPKIVERSEEMVESQEGCLSIPNVFGIVKRHRSVTVEAFDRDGNPVRMRVTAMPSVIFQHEIDHTNGILFTDPERLEKYTDEPRA